jgi:hypothetical protein
MTYAFGCSVRKKRLASRALALYLINELVKFRKPASIATDRAVFKYSEGVAQILTQQCAKSPAIQGWLCLTGLDGAA